MLAVLTISPQSLMHPPSSRTLTRMAADHELVLVCEHDVAPILIRTVRTLLPRHRLVAILVDRDLLRHEHDLLEMILNDGNLPLVLTTGAPTAIQLSEWLNAEAISQSPIPGPTAGRRLRFGSSESVRPDFGGVVIPLAGRTR